MVEHDDILEPQIFMDENMLPSNRNAITAGSHSRIIDFETCKLRAFIKYALRIPEPDRGPPPNGKEWPNERGDRIHKSIESFVKGETDTICPESHEFLKEIDHARTLNQAGIVETERMWCFDKTWKPVADSDYKNTWLRVKTDMTIMPVPTHAIVVDYKSGRLFGNEVKHGEQTQLYAIGAFKRYPNLLTVTTELWYIDQNDVRKNTYTRAIGERLSGSWANRNNKMISATVFPPSPSRPNCKYCPYNQTEHCRYGVV